MKISSPSQIAFGKCSLPLTACFMLSTAQHGNAAIIVSNLDQPVDPTTSYGVGNFFNPFINSAGFATGLNSAGYVLNSITLRMGDANGTPSGFRVAIWETTPQSLGSSVMVPTNELYSSAGDDNPATAGDYIYSFTNASLAANTAYAIVASADSQQGTFNIYTLPQADSTSESSTDGWTIADEAIGSSDMGASWPTVNEDGPFLFSVDADAIPEPSSLLLAVFGLGFLLPRRR